MERNIAKKEKVNITLTEFIEKIHENLGVVSYNIKNEVDSVY